MMKYKFLGILLCLFIMLACSAKPASATVIDVSYYWYFTGGTWVDPAGQDPGYGIGDTSGTLLFKVEELWIAGDQRQGAAYYPGIGQFKYDIHRVTVDENGEEEPIYDFKVYNPFHADYVATRTTDGALTWAANHTNDYWYWSTTTSPIDGVIGYFYIYTNAPRGIVSGEASDYINSNHKVFASGLVSGPVIPEASSMVLLGMGVLGLFTLKRRKS